MVYDPVLQEPLWIASLPESAKVALPFVETKYKGIVGVEILTAHKLCAVMYNDVVDRHLNGIYPVPHERCKWAEIAGDTWIKVLFAAEAKFLPQLEKDLESLSIEGIRLVHSEPEMIEMLPIHVSKGDALKRICNITGLNLSKATAIGDYYNDLEMIQEAHFGVAVENACEEIKAEADLIVGTNEQDAVAETIAYVMKNHPHIF
ncbi:MAG: HAD hydrolase family protein, partial [Oscillospiraceae bacterium]